MSKNKQPPLRKLILSNRIEPLVLSELATSQKLLSLQQNDNYKYQEHVTLLDGEIDALKVIVEKKQILINKKDDEIRKHVGTIRVLEEELQASNARQRKMKGSEESNNLLLEDLKKKNSETDCLSKELNDLRHMHNAVTEYWDSKQKEAIDGQANLVAKIAILEHTTRDAIEKKVAAEQLATGLQLDYVNLQEKLRLSEDIRLEQISRSRQTEYKTLRKYDEVTSELQEEKDSKSQLQETLNLAIFRGDFLEERLQHALETAGELQDKVVDVIDEIGVGSGNSRMQLKILTKENEKLQSQLQISELAIKDLTETMRRYELNKVLSAKPPKDVQASTCNIAALDAASISSIISEHVDDNLSLTSLNSVQDGGESVVIPGYQASDISSPSNVMPTDGSAPPTRYPEDGDNTNVLLLGDKGFQQGHQTLLYKYLQWVVNASDLQILDFAGIGLTDRDFKQVVEWIRLMSVSHIKCLDLRHNFISGKGAQMLALWLAALPPSDLAQRRTPLEIDLRHNLVSERAIESLASTIKQAPRSEISLVQYDQETCSISIYDARVGASSSSSKGSNDLSPLKRVEVSAASRSSQQGTVEQEPAARLLVRIDLRFNSKKKTPAGMTVMAHEITIQPSLAASLFLSHDDELSAGNTNLTLPRDEIMRRNL